MVRESFAILLMLLLIAASIWNIYTADELSGSILSQLDAAENAACSGNWEEAASSVKKGLDIWLNAERYTHIFIRHPEIDNCTDVFFDACEAVASENMTETQARLATLRYHLNSIASMEQVSLGNIF